MRIAVHGWVNPRDEREGDESPLLRVISALRIKRSVIVCPSLGHKGPHLLLWNAEKNEPNVRIEWDTAVAHRL